MVRLQPLGGFRDLAVKIDLRGSVAPGYLTTNVSVNPQVVTVFGSSAALEAVPGFISTEPVSVTDATDDISSRVRLVLPPGVSYLGDPTVQVDVKIKAIESSLTTFAPLSPQGLSPDLSARFSPESLDVILSGPIAQIECPAAQRRAGLCQSVQSHGGHVSDHADRQCAQRHQCGEHPALDRASHHRAVCHADDYGHGSHHRSPALTHAQEAVGKKSK